jgi:hypothetical protein
MEQRYGNFREKVLVAIREFGVPQQPWMRRQVAGMSLLDIRIMCWKHQVLSITQSRKLPCILLRSSHQRASKSTAPHEPMQSSAPDAVAFAKTLGMTVEAGEPRATHRRPKRPYKRRVSDSAANRLSVSKNPS